MLTTGWLIFLIISVIICLVGFAKKFQLLSKTSNKGPTEHEHSGPKKKPHREWSLASLGNWVYVVFVALLTIVAATSVIVAPTGLTRILTIAFFVVLSLTLFMNGYRECDAAPFRVAKKRLNRYISYKVNGHDTITLYDGGNHFFLFYPKFEKDVIIDCSDKNFKGETSQVRAKDDDLDISVPWEVTWYVDEDNAKRFLQACGGVQDEDGNRTQEKHFKKVHEILTGLIDQNIITIAADEKPPTTWRAFYAEARRIADRLVRSISEQEGAKQESPEVTASKDDSPTENNAPNSAIVACGKWKVRGLGIVIKRFNIFEPKLPEGALEDARGKEREKMQREKEEVEIAWGIEAMNLIQQGSKLSPDKAMDFFQSERGKAIRQIISIDQGGQSGSGGGTTPVIVIPAQPLKQ